VSFVSFTVPQYQRDESYFAPLAELAADPDTELNFALVPYHPADQAPGTTDDQVRAEDLLRQGYAVSGVRDRDAIVDWLRLLCEETGRTLEAKDFARQERV